MPRARRQRVVGFVGMGHRAVHERGLDRADEERVTRDSCHRLAAVRARELSAARPGESSDPETIAANVSRTCHVACSITSAGRARSRARLI